MNSFLSTFLQKKQKKITKISNGAPQNTSATTDDPFGDNDDDVTRIAKEMEAKYVRNIHFFCTIFVNLYFFMHNVGRRKFIQ